MRPEAENWWKQARKDLEAAHKNLGIEEYYLVAFLCQQAVEKGLKALYIVKRRQAPPQHHSLIFLGEEVKLPKMFYSFLRTINKEFVVSRYPDAAYGVPYELYDKTMVVTTLEKTEEVFTWIKSQLKT